jgi:hypothetical protein
VSIIVDLESFLAACSLVGFTTVLVHVSCEKGKRWCNWYHGKVRCIGCSVNNYYVMTFFSHSDQLDNGRGQALEKVGAECSKSD